jgi:hypothetical protein
MPVHGHFPARCPGGGAKYGIIPADNGSSIGNWFVTGAPDSRWDDDDLNTLKQLRGSDCEFVDTGPVTPQVVDALGEVSAKPGDVVGRLRLSVPRLAAPFVVSPVLPAFRARHPRIEGCGLVVDGCARPSGLVGTPLDGLDGD